MNILAHRFFKGIEKIPQCILLATCQCVTMRLYCFHKVEKKDQNVINPFSQSLAYIDLRNGTGCYSISSYRFKKYYQALNCTSIVSEGNREAQNYVSITRSEIFRGILNNYSGATGKISENYRGHYVGEVQIFNV